jgi:rod shape-determining protein MreD
VKAIFVIFLSFVLAIIFQTIPLPRWVDSFRPEWVILVLVYWSLTMPQRVSVGIAFFVGLFMDLLTGTLLGEHAVIFVLITYFVVKFSTRIRLFPTWQQAATLFVLVLFYEGIQYWIHGLMGQLPGTWLYWLPSVTTALLWPWVYSLLKQYRQRSRTGMWAK